VARDHDPAGRLCRICRDHRRRRIRLVVRTNEQQKTSGCNSWSALGLWAAREPQALGRSVEPYALQRFSTLAMVSVLALVITGIVNSLRHLDAVDQLWQSRYGLTLMIKLALVAATLAAAAVSRRRLQQHRVPPQSVRIEAALTVA
jgi:putative copper export protein